MGHGEVSVQLDEWKILEFYQNKNLSVLELCQKFKFPMDHSKLLFQHQFNSGCSIPTLKDLVVKFMHRHPTSLEKYIKQLPQELVERLQQAVTVHNPM